ncbi:hypothetical protein [Emticicia oligotrophica]|nr:hypothetical protein [Emticicia oligotrophica]
MKQYRFSEKETRIYALVVTVGLFIAMIWGISQCSSSNTHKAEKGQLKIKVDSLAVIKNRLERDISEISSKLTSIESQNETFASNIATLEGAMKQKEIIINKYKKDSQNANSLKNQIKELLALKTELLRRVEELNEKSNSLLSENQKLREENSRLSLKNEQLEEQLSANVATLAIKPLLSAGSFRVEVLKRNDKLTVKSRRTRQLDVSFDLPKDLGLEGTQLVYLCIKDQNSNPIQDRDNKNIEIDLGEGREIKAIAQSTQTLNFDNLPKRISIKYAIENKLKAGYYFIEIYTNSSFIGGVQFRVI